MYVVTFYSYKGGVGRTMALVNVAVSLAASGKRVLIADFDLEAPGVPSYETFSCADHRPGIVDYVTAYRATGVAPEIGDYIVEAELDETKLWLLPAGRHTDRGYTEMLNDIDWQDLYERQSGFLMFEDMRRQWQQYQGRGFDYVFIDSRTGHTDVGGICTRQLPDSVVIMFVPNKQNIDGLEPIVESIRQEKDHGGREIKLHFCPSNVPALDDDRDILKELRAHSRSKLNYEEPAAVIQHYSSLEILKQTAFIKRRATTQLSREYHELKTAIIKNNLEDPEGVAVALERMPDEYDQARRAGNNKALEEIRSAATRIRALHPKDGKIALLVARVFARVGDSQNELAALTTAIETGHEATRTRSYRGNAYATLGMTNEARADFREVLASPAAKPFDVLPALHRLPYIDEDWKTAFLQAFQRPDTAVPVLSLIATWLQTDRDLLPLVAEKMLELAAHPLADERERQSVRNILSLALIGSGRFDLAIEWLVDGRASGRTFADIFNLAMAEWGRDNEPPIARFETLAQQRVPLVMRDIANVHQCLAIVHGVLGDRDRAEEEIRLARREATSGQVFSCWRFLYVDHGNFMRDVDIIAGLVKKGAVPEPPFFAEVRPRLL